MAKSDNDTGKMPVLRQNTGETPVPRQNTGETPVPQTPVPRVRTGQRVRYASHSGGIMPAVLIGFSDEEDQGATLLVFRAGGAFGPAALMCDVPHSPEPKAGCWSA